MPREVFADEIERFLATLDGVSSARVLAGTGGDISFVYVTTDGATDSRSLRGGVAAALQAHFGIPIDEWRVRVTQLRTGAQRNEIPHFHVARVEETAAGTDLAVTIRLRWTQGAEERTAVGKARVRVLSAREPSAGRGPAAGATGRSRAMAAATIAAVRDALDIPHAELALDRVGSVTFLDRPMVLAALSCAVAGRRRTHVGAAFDEGTQDPSSEPAITAALDAVTRWLVERAFAADGPQPQERRDRLEAMRHFVLDAASAAPSPDKFAAVSARVGGATPLGAEQEAPEEDHAAEPARMPATLSDEGRVRALPPRRAAMMRNGEGASVRFAGAAAEAPDADSAAIAVPGEFRRRAHDAGVPVELASHEDAARRRRNADLAPGPKAGETKEGTTLSLQHDTSESATVGRGVRAPGVEDAFYRSLVGERTPVHLRCRDGYEVPHAIVRDTGTYALLVETEDGLELFFKHAIISIRVLPKAPQA
jgi:hypothetical protein